MTIPNSVTYIGSSVFEYCESLTSVSIGSGLKSISAYAFCECSALTNITIPEGVTSISEGAFWGCGAMTSINIPSSVTSIGERAFDRCRALEAVHITDLSAWCRISYATDVYSDIFGYLIYSGQLEYSEQPLYYAHHLYLNNQEIKDLIIPEDVTCVSNLAFAGCSGLSSITIPGTVKSLGAGAFYQCGLAKIIVPDIAAWCNMSFEGYGSNPIPFVGSLYSDAETVITNLVIPSGVTSIGDGAFSWCRSLTSVTIPESVTNIGQGAFNNCENLASVTISEGVTKIGEGAFCACGKLVSITLPESVTRIDSFAFEGCGALRDIKIPKSTTSIGRQAFAGCHLTEITIPENLTLIDGLVFRGCPLTSIKVEEGNPIFDSRNDCNAIIETASNTLIQGCQNTIIPPSVASIGGSAFQYCSGLTSIFIPEGVTNIGAWAFSGCSSLNNVYCFATEPPIAVYKFNKYDFGYSFDISHIEEHTTLYVPENSLESYRTSLPWSNFKNIVALTQDEIDGIQEIKNEELRMKNEGEWYSLDGRKLGGKPMKSGLYINNGRKVVVK